MSFGRSAYSTAPTGQILTHIGSPPHKVHFTRPPPGPLKLIFPSGQALRHILHPMHLEGSYPTTPVLSHRVRAPTGQTSTQWGSLHCMHINGTVTQERENSNTVTAEAAGLNTSALLKAQISSQLLHPIQTSGLITSNFSISPQTLLAFSRHLLIKFSVS